MRTMSKRCNRCLKVKENSEFPKQSQNKDGLRGECKECKNLYSREYMTKDKRKHYMLKHAYGITLKTYNKLKSDQNYYCAICKVKEEDLRCELVVDHCHDTGKIRGLLCESCNLGLGKFRDNEELVFKAFEYLKENK